MLLNILTNFIRAEWTLNCFLLYLLLLINFYTEFSSFWVFQYHKWNCIQLWIRYNNRHREPSLCVSRNIHYVNKWYNHSMLLSEWLKGLFYKRCIDTWIRENVFLKYWHCRNHSVSFWLQFVLGSSWLLL